MKLSLYILWRYIYIPANIHVVDYTYVYIIICTCKPSSTPVCSQGWSLLVFVKLVVTYLWSLSSCFLFWLVCYPLGFNNLCVCVCVCVCTCCFSLSSFLALSAWRLARNSMSCSSLNLLSVSLRCLHVCVCVCSIKLI